MANYNVKINVQLNYVKWINNFSIRSSLFVDSVKALQPIL